ncbi:glycosyltransferase family 2 protein [Flavobacterium okayamense]|uniref:Glycosyltransferase 2-like domain-containing protein n=1 Tax=Flavobacterium okayamense TaxID=2830782 RepID=A0ABN6HUN8_9FLAO|nr:glycosyltransferase family 2 protein [Flavobacterium okayamense]BCY27252.1 hypothetical protein KK2020170_01200 [Flavobacterium okayamense]
MPRVSIIVPNYNHEKYLNDRLKSIFNQTFQDFEIILMDDRSLDGSVEVLKNYSKNSKVSHLILNDINSGSPFGMWKKGFELAKGEFIWIAESDDWANENLLFELVNAIEKDTSIVVAHCNSYFEFYEKTIPNNWWDSLSLTYWQKSYVESGEKLLLNYGRYKCPVINVSSAIIRKDILKNIEIPIEFRYCGDWWFWAQIFKQGKVTFIAKYFNHIRMHSSSATATKSLQTFNRFLENVRVVKQIHQLLNIRFTYSKKYKWLIDIWEQFIRIDKNYLKTKYYCNDLPFFFKSAMFFRVNNLLFKRLKRKIKI